MTCPFCGSEMRHGEITADNTILRWIEGDQPKSKVRKIFSLRTEGNLLKVPQTAWRPWIPADFCPKCKKMIYETDILQT